MSRLQYTLTVAAIFVAANAIMLAFRMNIGPLFNPDTNPLPLGVRFAASIALCYVSIDRAKNAGGRGMFIAWLQLLFFLIPPVWLGTIYLMLVRPAEPQGVPDSQTEVTA